MPEKLRMKRKKLEQRCFEQGEKMKEQIFEARGLSSSACEK
jgi:hypothetical protein